MRRLALITGVLVSLSLTAPACNKLASRERVEAIKRVNKGVELKKKKNIAGAIKAIQEALQVDPTYAEAHYLLGRLYADQTKWVDAEKEFDGAIKVMNPPNPDYWYEMGIVQTAQADMGEKSVAEKETIYRKAISSYQEAIKLNPKHHKAHHQTGVLQEKLDEPENADASYRKSIDVKPDYALPYVQLGNMYIDYGFSEVAMTVLQEGININDTSAYMWNGLGRAHQTLGNPTEAVDAFQKAKAIDPDMVDVLFGLGMAYADLRQRKDAIENFEMFLQKAGNKAPPHIQKTARDTMARMQDVI